MKEIKAYKPCPYCKAIFNSVKERIKHECILKKDQKTQFCFICSKIVRGGNMNKHKKTKMHLTNTEKVDKLKFKSEKLPNLMFQSFNEEEPSGSLDINPGKKRHQKIRIENRRAAWGICVDDERKYDLISAKSAQEKSEILERRKNLTRCKEIKQIEKKKVEATRKDLKMKNSKKLIRKYRKKK